MKRNDLLFFIVIALLAITISTCHGQTNGNFKRLTADTLQPRQSSGMVIKNVDGIYVTAPVIDSTLRNWIRKIASFDTSLLDPYIPWSDTTQHVVTKYTANFLSKVKYKDTVLMYMPEQVGLTGSLYYGNGGSKLVHTTGSTGRYNMGFGLGAGFNLTSGNGHTSLGFGANFSSTTGSGNTSVGLNSSYFATNALGNTALGNTSLYSNLGSFNNAFGNGAGTFGTFTNSILFGYQAGQGTSGKGLNQVGLIKIGYQAGRTDTISNRLYMENSSSQTPLIGGKFDEDKLGVNKLITATWDSTLNIGGGIDARGGNFSSNISSKKMFQKFILDTTSSNDLQMMPRRWILDHLNLKQNSMPVTKTIYVDVNRTDSYVENGSQEKPFKTLTEACAIATSGKVLIVEAGTYAETVVLPNGVSIINQNSNKAIINGNFTVTASTNISIRGIQFANGYTLTVNAPVSFIDCFASGAVIVNNVVTQGYNFHIVQGTSGVTALTVIGSGAKAQFIMGTIQSTGDVPTIYQTGGSIILDKMAVYGSRAGAVISSTGGYIVATGSQIINMSGGTAADLQNGATSGAPNMIADVYAVGAMACGTAYTFVEGLQFGAVGSLSGSALYYRPGAQISNTPAGNIAATTVQAAINELDTEKQVNLVSGTNIKTINSNSILGSGDLVIGGAAKLTQSSYNQSDSYVVPIAGAADSVPSTGIRISKTATYLVQVNWTVNTLNCGITSASTGLYTGVRRWSGTPVGLFGGEIWIPDLPVITDKRTIVQRTQSAILSLAAGDYINCQAYWGTDPNYAGAGNTKVYTVYLTVQEL